MSASVIVVIEDHARNGRRAELLRPIDRSLGRMLRRRMLLRLLRVLPNS